MQKFPLRMKDNDLLVTELYRDPNADSITAISVYLTPKTTVTGSVCLLLLTFVLCLLLKFVYFQQLDRDRLRDQLGRRQGHRAAPGDRRPRPSALSGAT